MHEDGLAHAPSGVPGLSLVRGAAVFAPEPCGVKDLLLSGSGVVQLDAERLRAAEALVSPENIVDAAGCFAVPGTSSPCARQSRPRCFARVSPRPSSPVTTAGASAGLVDMHVHICGGGGEAGTPSPLPSVQLLSVKSLVAVCAREVP